MPSSEMLTKRLATAFRGSRNRPFMIDLETDRSGRRCLIVHLSRKATLHDDGPANEDIAARLRQESITESFRVVQHKNFDRWTSLEQFVAALSPTEIVYDPTGAFVRACTLLRATQKLRAALGHRLIGIYVSSVWRTVFVLLDRTRMAGPDCDESAVLAEVKRQVPKAFAAEDGTGTLPLAIRTGFKLPRTELVAVDRASVLSKSPSTSWIGKAASIPLIGALALAMAGAANAASAPSAIHARHFQPGFQALFGLAFAEARLTRYDYDAVLQELGTYFGRSASSDRHLQRYSAGDGDQRSSAPLRRHSQRLDEAQNDLAQTGSPGDEDHYDPYGNSNRDDGSWSSGW